MSIIEKALTREGLKLTGDTLPADQRTQRVFKRVIAAIRAAEAEVLDNLMTSEREANEAHKKCLDQQEHIRQLEGELLRFRMKDRLACVEALTVGDRTKLLELCVADGSK